MKLPTVNVSIDAVNAAINRREHLKSRVAASSFSASAEPNRAQKEYLADRVRVALVAAAKNDPVNDFSNCDCLYHNTAQEVGDTLTASVVWRPSEDGLGRRLELMKRVRSLLEPESLVAAAPSPGLTGYIRLVKR